MKIEQRIKYQTLLLSFAVVAITSLVVFYYLNYFFDKKIDDEVKAKEQTVERLFEHIKGQTSVAEERHLKRIINIKDAKKHFFNRDREALYTTVNARFQELRKESRFIKIMTFRLPDGSTFLRMHRPEMYGDSLNQKRRIIIDTNLLKKKHVGFEVGKLEMTYRIVLPVFYEDKYAGLIELGIDPGYFMKTMEDVIELKYALVIRKEMKDVLLERRNMPERDGFLLASGAPLFNEIFESVPFNQRTFTQVGNTYYSINSSLKLLNHKKEPAAFILSAEDITPQMAAHKNLQYAIGILLLFFMIVLFLLLNYYLDLYITKIQKQLYTDELTGLPNRDALGHILKEEKDAVLMLIDINAFKTINELYGVKGGNTILQHFASYLHTFAKENKLQLFRVSADEFVLLRISDELESIQYYENFLDKLFEDIKEKKFPLNDLGISIDIDFTAGAVYEKDATLENAHMALKNAREKKLPFLFYSNAIDTKGDTHRVVKLKKELRHAIDNKNIVAYFQPIVDRDGSVIKYESLVRLEKTGEGGTEIISPYAFLALSHKFNLYPALSKIMVAHGFNTVANTDHIISINLSPSDLMNDQMQAYIFERLRECEKPENIIFEITENENIDDYEHVKRFVVRIQGFGSKIAIDDFGSGYSNYAHIFELKPDYLKIDGSLIKDLLHNKESQTFVKTIVLLARELGIKTIAEYVYNEELYHLTKELGVDEFQGYYFGEPSPLFKPD